MTPTDNGWMTVGNNKGLNQYFIKRVNNLSYG